MSKLFFEVFPTLKAEGDIRELFSDTAVVKVATNSARTFIKVHLESSHLIQKSRVREVERLIQAQLFPSGEPQVEIVETFALSKQYTPENIMQEYYESFLFELNERSVVERSMFQNAGHTFE